MIVTKREELKIELAWGVRLSEVSRFFQEKEMEFGGDAEIDMPNEWEGDRRLFIEYEREETGCERRHREAQEATDIITKETQEILEYKRLKAKYGG